MNRGYTQRKRITGHQETYVWQDPKPASSRRRSAESARPQRESAFDQPNLREEVRRQEKIQKKKEQIMNTLAMYLLLVCVVFGVFAVIGKLSQISMQNRANNELIEAISDLQEEKVSDAKLLEYETRYGVIKPKAEAQLRMFLPEEEQVAYLHNVTRYTNDEVQTAEGIARSR